MALKLVSNGAVQIVATSHVNRTGGTSCGFFSAIIIRIAFHLHLVPAALESVAVLAAKYWPNCFLAAAVGLLQRHAAGVAFVGVGPEPCKNWQSLGLVQSRVPT